VILSGCGAQAAPSPSSVLKTPVEAASPSPRAVAKAQPPVKGLADNPGYQWWRRLDSPEPDSWWGDGQTRQSLQQQVDLMHELGTGIFRVEVIWPFVEPSMPGGTQYDTAIAQNPDWSGYRWDRMDLIVDVLTQAHIDILPVVDFTPTWARTVVPGHPLGGPQTPPASSQYFGDFMQALASRYLGRIHYWELGNEMDDRDHSWNGTFAQYVELLLKPGYTSVKSADPQALVVMGGLAVDTHMSALYDAGGGPYFDIANFHAYYTAAAGDSTAWDHIRHAMGAHGDFSKPIWLTEFGYATRTADLTGTASPSDLETAQAALIRDVFTGIKVQAIFFYELRDTAVIDNAGRVLKYVYWGLVTRDLSRRKPGFAAYEQVAGGVLPRPQTIPTGYLVA
jgi:hypothetical protein